ncbi:MAG: hypothetical protein Q7S33_01590 [Nanoarchaeota archaeon]|nr:hypothetical protein [Nanoarchaeota archaeon]
MEDKKVRAIIILEALGRPPEYIHEFLTNHVEQLKNAKGVQVLSQTVHEPKKLENQEEEAHTCFAEIDLRVENLYKMMEIIFDYMPSSIEIIEPDELNLNLSEVNGFLNDLSGRLHKYDEIVKIMQLQSNQLSAKLQIMEKQFLNNALVASANATQIEQKAEVKEEKPVKKKKGKNIVASQ